MVAPSTIWGAGTGPLRSTRFGEVDVLGAVDSTNTLLLARARAGAPEGTAVVADVQTAGRGRRGRSWFAGPGTSLLVSVLLRPELPPGRLALVTLACALALAEAVHEVAGFRPGLKWPNDLVVGERKLAGLLAEADVGAAGPAAVVVGAGLNVAPGSFPPELGERATSCDEIAGRSVGRGALLVAYLVALERRYAVLTGPGGPEALVEECRGGACLTIGRPVRVELASGALEGTAADLGPGGELVVLRPDGARETVTAGDVIHLRPAGPPAGG